MRPWITLQNKLLKRFLPCWYELFSSSRNAWKRKNGNLELPDLELNYSFYALVMNIGFKRFSNSKGHFQTYFLFYEEILLMKFDTDKINMEAIQYWNLKLHWVFSFKRKLKSCCHMKELKQRKVVKWKRSLSKTQTIWNM